MIPNPFPVENKIGMVFNRKRGFAELFNPRRIAKAVLMGANSTGGFLKYTNSEQVYAKWNNPSEEEIAWDITNRVITSLNSDSKWLAPQNPVPVDVIHDTVIQTLEDTGYVSIADVYSIYREGRHAVNKGWITKDEFVGTGFPSKAIDSLKEFYHKQGVDTIEDLNAKVKAGEFINLLNTDYERYLKEIKAVADAFIEYYKSYAGKRALITMAGPSSSGKSSTAHILMLFLKTAGYKVRVLGGDNYFLNSGCNPRSYYGDLDYEQPWSMDLQLLNANLCGMLLGEKVETPIFDFVSSTRVSCNTEMWLDKNEILILDSLHGLYPPITRDLPLDICFYPLAIEARTGFYPECRFLHVRLLRRLVRDVLSRGTDTKFNLEHWPSVRKGVCRIIPYLGRAKQVINGSLITDLPTMVYGLSNVERLSNGKFKSILTLTDSYLKELRDNQRMLVYWLGRDLKTLIGKVVQPTSAEIDAIAQHSMVREFIGGQVLPQKLATINF